MKKAEKLLLGACAYAVAISLLFLAFAAISGFVDASLSFTNYLLMIFFGGVITAANEILKLNGWHAILKLAIHYCALLSAFFVVFIISGNIRVNGATSIFVSIFVFTFLYAIIFTLAYFAKKSVTKIDKKLEAKKASKKQSDTTYTSRFK